LRTNLSGNQFLYLILLLLTFFPESSIGQDRLLRRKTEFFQSIETLRLHPEKINLHPKSRTYNHDSLQHYYNKLLAWYSQNSLKINKWQQIAYFYETGHVQLSLELTDSAINSFESALLLLNQKQNPKEHLRLKAELAFAYRESNSYKKSNEIYLEILQLPIIQADTIEQNHFTYFLAENYENMGEYQKSMEMCWKLYNYSLKKKDFANASYNLIQIGRMAAYLEKDTSYFEYFHMANSLAAKSGVKKTIGNNFASTAYAYSKREFHDKALWYFQLSESYKPYLPVRDYLYCLSGLSTTYLKSDSLEKAFLYAKKSLQIASEIKGYQWMTESCKVVADYYLRVSKYDSARYYLKEAVTMNKLSGSERNTASLYRNLATVSTLLYDYKNAFLYLDTAYNAYNDFVTKTNNDKLAQLRNESDYYIHKAKILELVSHNKIEKEKSKKLAIMIAAVSIVLIMSILFSVLRRRQMKRLKDSYYSLVKKNIELDALTGKLTESEIYPERKTKSESIKDEQIIIRKLIKMLQTDNVFTNPDLSLKMLADELNTNTTYLSAIVNTHFNSNLKTLINKYRIEKARKLMISDQYKNYSMDGIAAEVGFRSRSGFYTAFKTVTGLTPTIYIENYKLVINESIAEQADEADSIS
jgi:AraC-like DNA-binding protein